VRRHREEGAALHLKERIRARYEEEKITPSKDESPKKGHFRRRGRRVLDFLRGGERTAPRGPGRRGSRPFLCMEKRKGWCCTGKGTRSPLSGNEKEKKGLKSPISRKKCFAVKRDTPPLQGNK